jgi:hypothetical protein
MTAFNVRFSEDFIFVANGLVVDIYGVSASRVDTMPSPRPDDYFFPVDLDAPLTYYSEPDDQSEPYQVERFTSCCYVLGWDTNKEWIYILFHQPLNPYSFHTVTGWVPADTFVLPASLIGLPALDSKNPIGSLRQADE